MAGAPGPAAGYAVGSTGSLEGSMAPAAATAESTEGGHRRRRPGKGAAALAATLVVAAGVGGWLGRATVDDGAAKNSNAAVSFQIPSFDPGSGILGGGSSSGSSSGSGIFGGGSSRGAPSA